MLYLDYSRNHGEWVPNRFGGRENLEAIDFLRQLNTLTHAEAPGSITIAEESTAWPSVSRPTCIWRPRLHLQVEHGLDERHPRSTSRQDPVYRRYHHRHLTFSLLYAFSENFILPFSHDEVVHGKGSMFGKMPGDDWQKAATLRALYGFMYAHPGKKLMFMGGEFGQGREWNHDRSLDWHLLDQPLHAGLQRFVQDLNRVYAAEPALHEVDFDVAGFQWIDCNDSENSVVSFIRRAKNAADFLVAVLNFTPVPREGYRIGVPAAGGYARCSTATPASTAAATSATAASSSPSRSPRTATTTRSACACRRSGSCCSSRRAWTQADRGSDRVPGGAPFAATSSCRSAS